MCTSMKENTTTQCIGPKALKVNLLMPSDPLNPPIVSLYFSDLLPTYNNA